MHGCNACLYICPCATAASFTLSRISVDNSSPYGPAAFPSFYSCTASLRISARPNDTLAAQPACYVNVTSLVPGCTLQASTGAIQADPNGAWR